MYNTFMRKILIYLFFAIIIVLPVLAKHRFQEKYYQNCWCKRWHGQAEYKLDDYCRVDCLTKNYAVEFDFAPKWAEAVGQSLHYSIKTGKKPAIILILENHKDWRYYNRLKVICPRLGISIWYMVAPDYY